MKRFAIAVALVATLSFAGSVQAADTTGSATAVIDGVTGQVVVSVTDVSNWFISSPAGLLSGPDGASPLPLSGGGFATDNDFSVGETNLVAFSYADINLGIVVQPGSPNDFIIRWVGDLGTHEGSASITFVPEPTSLALAGISLCGLLVTRRRRVA